MKIMGLSAALLVVGSAQAQAYDTQVSEKAYRNVPGCQAAAYSDPIGADLMWHAGFCVGYLMALAAPQPNPHGICVPAGVPVTELPRVFVAYLESHSIEDRDYFQGVAVRALRAAYPCPRSP